MKAFKSGSINDPRQLEEGYLGLNLVPAEVRGQKYHVDICLAVKSELYVTCSAIKALLPGITAAFQPAPRAPEIG